MTSSLDSAIRAASETALAHGIVPDRCDILQNSSTLVLRLTETLVARVVQDRDGPRQGTEWFARENVIAQHLTMRGAPVIPLHPDLPPGPHEHLGFPLNFWEFVTRVEDEPEPREIGHTLRQCHEIMRDFPEPLPTLAILTESLAILKDRELFPDSIQQMLRDHLTTSIEALSGCTHQALHGDAHMGNLMNTTRGLLWTDWEDTFSGPVEWDVASIIWNARILEEDHASADAIVDAYRAAGGELDMTVLQHCMIGRAAVMTAWYPILYPEPNEERQARLQRRIAWLKQHACRA
ncbi:MAG: aminoglycoside phosphotransferase family protein [Verrucomicrobiaceae bacterium]|nr:aminoglycoside phosphotransferase family protein [Verrucomicrobiaceae bacterium]